MMTRSSGVSSVLSNQNWNRRSLVACRAGHWNSMWTRSPLTLKQLLARQYPSLLEGVQCLQRYSDRNLPEIILATTRLFETSKLLLPANSQSRQGFSKDIRVVLKTNSDDSSSVSSLNNRSQYSTTLVFTRRWNFCFDNGCHSRVRG